jgi:D-alanyl-D-alanine carboxypeptidase
MHDATTPRPLASITKLASAAAFFDHAELAATTSLTWSDLNTYGEAGRLQYGDVLTHHQLLFPLLMESSNDAAAAMERIDTELIAQMEALAAEAGAAVTFADASGLSTENRASAEALAVLGRHLFAHYPHLIDISRREEHLLTEDRAWVNNNPFISDPRYRGGKHGYLPEAGRTALAFFEEELAGETFLIGYVVLGSGPLPESVGALREYLSTHAELR